MASKKAKGKVYVMTLKGAKQDVVRVGHHSSSNKQREKEVSNGSGEAWEIAYCICVGSKLKAAAVEAVAHATLEYRECWRTALRKSKTGKDISQQVFRCPGSEAQDAIEKAIRTLRYPVVSCKS